MSDIRIATTVGAGFRRLEVHDQPVVAMHRQLAAILGNRLGRQHALLLSRPEINPDDDSIAWFTPSSGAGEVRRLADLPEDQRRPVEVLARQLIAEIRQLAGKMKHEGDSAALAGHMLELAVLDPADDALYAVDGQPVLVRWGYVAPGQPVPDAPRPMPRAAVPPPIPSEVPAAVPPALPPEVPPEASDAVPPAAPEPAAAGVSVAAMAAPAQQRSWLAWLLPLLLLLLLAWLVWRALQPLPPEIVELAAPASPPAADPVAPEQEREKELRAELARLTQARDDKLALCKPIAPPPAPAPVPPPEEPKVTEAPPPTPLPPVPEPRPTPPKPVAPPAKVEARPPPPPKAAPPEQQAAVVPPPSPPPPPPAPKAPPRSACQLNVAPGDEPEVVVIVDGSGSMREPFAGASSRMALAKDSLESVVKGLPPEVDVALIDFSDCDQVRLDKFYSSPQRPSLIGEVRGLQPDRGTPLARSIERAGNIVSSGVESTIVVISDGADTCGRDPCAAARAVKARRPNVTINVIDVSGGDGRATAQCIAGATGGKVLTPNSTLDMKNKVQQATRLPDTRNCQP